MLILKISRSSPASVPNAVKKKKYFQMNLTGPTAAAVAAKPSISQLARLKAKAKVYHPDNKTH
jgi:hypothetical protein